MSIRHKHKSDKKVFLNEQEILEALTSMEQDIALLTEKGYTNELFVEHRLVSFTEKHTTYLKTHPKIDPANYLANLRTMIKIRR